MFLFGILTCTNGTPRPLLDLPDSPNNFKLCVGNYLKVTRQWKIDESYIQLLISTLNHHRPVVRSAVANWVKGTIIHKVFETNSTFHVE